MTALPGLPPARVVIADDRSRTRRALRALLATQPGFAVVGEAADGEESVASVERLRPDLVLLDVRMPRLDGVAAAARIEAGWPAASSSTAWPLSGWAAEQFEISKDEFLALLARHEVPYIALSEDEFRQQLETAAPTRQLPTR